MKKMIVLSFAAAFCLCLLPHAAAFAGCGDRPGTPADVRAEALSQSSIKFSWRDTTRPGEIPLGPFYDIEVTDSGGKSLKQSTTGQGYLFGGKVYKKLDFNKEYCFRIRARTEAGTQGCVSERWSARVCATTYAPPIAKPTPPEKSAPPPLPPPPKYEPAPLPVGTLLGVWDTQTGDGQKYTLLILPQGNQINVALGANDKTLDGTIQASFFLEHKRMNFVLAQPGIGATSRGSIQLTNDDNFTGTMTKDGGGQTSWTGTRRK
jgi:hypothetical protein